MSRASLAAAAVVATFVAAPASAVTVSLSGLVVNSCVLTIGTSGVLAPAASGTRLGSEETGGSAATLTIVALGTAPTLTFAAPTLSAPVGSSGSTTEIRYSGANAAQGYTASSSTASARLIDLFTVNARVTNSAGFVSGTYTAATVVTCGQ